MNKQIKVAKLADFELRRFEEIDFYFKMLHLFKVFGHNQETYDLIEIICQACNASQSIIKTLTSNLLAANSLIKPSQWEMIILMYRNDVKLNEIVNASGASTRTIYRRIREYNESDGVDTQFLPRIKEDYHEHITRFNKKMKELMNYDGYSV